MTFASSGEKSHYTQPNCEDLWNLCLITNLHWNRSCHDVDIVTFLFHSPPLLFASSDKWLEEFAPQASTLPAVFDDTQSLQHDLPSIRLQSPGPKLASCWGPVGLVPSQSVSLCHSEKRCRSHSLKWLTRFSAPDRAVRRWLTEVLVGKYYQKGFRPSVATTAAQTLGNMTLVFAI